MLKRLHLTINYELIYFNNMDVVNAFMSTEKFLAFFSKADKAILEHQKNYQEIVAGIEKKFQELINDGKPNKIDDFRVPELPRTKKEPKEKRVSRANSRSTVSSTKNDSEGVPPPVKAVNLSVTVDSTNTESVKKRVEEFEKRTAAAVFSASKLPIMTPEKKAQLYSSSENQQLKVHDGCVKGLVFTEKETSVAQGRCTRNTSKVLQEKNTNIKMIKEKGHEAQKKKEVIIKASAEETKRRREERIRKVAAQREAAEKEKLELAMKLEKEKEMKLRLIQKQKDEKLKTETLKKKQLAAMKAAENEERRKKEAARIIKMKETEQKQEHCDYGIDHVMDEASSDDEEKPKNQIPSWATKQNRKFPLGVQSWLNRKDIAQWFYIEKLKYPNLEELFSAGIKMRPRTSSAYWNSKICFDESFR